MNGRKLVLGALTAFAVAFLLSGLWHVLLMSDFYDAAQGGTMRDPPLFWSIGLGYLVVGFIMAYTIPRATKGAPRSAKG